MPPTSSLARQSLGHHPPPGHRRRARERLVIANFTEHPERLTIELSLAADAADIFEVRGYERARVGTSLPDRRRADPGDLRLRGLDRMLRPHAGRVHAGASVRRPTSARGGRVAAPLVVRAGARTIEAGGRVELRLDRLGRTSCADPDGTPPLAAEPRRPAAGRRSGRRPPPIAGLARRDGRRRLRQRARSTGSSGGAWPTCACCSNDGPRPGRALPGRGRAVVHHALRARRAHHRATRRSPSGRPSPSRRSRSWPPARRRRSTTRPRRGAGQDPPRAADRRDGPDRRAAASRRTTARVDCHPAVADPPRRDVRLDRRPRPRRPALAERPRRARAGSTDYGDLDGTGSSSTSAGRRSGLLNQGWKDSSDAIRDRTGATVERADRAGRGPGLRLRREAPDGRARPAPRRRGSRDAARARGDRAPGTVRRRVLGRRPALLRDGARAGRQAADGALASNAGQCLWSGIVDPERAPGRRRPADRPDQLDSGWGIRTYGSGQPGYNPIGYHTGTSGRTTTRSSSPG